MYICVMKFSFTEIDFQYNFYEQLLSKKQVLESKFFGIVIYRVFLDTTPICDCMNRR